MFPWGRSVCAAAFSFLLTSCVSSFAQTEIDDVHVTPPGKGIELASAATTPGLSGASLIRTSVDLVLVPVTITDNFNRPVVGLDQENFQLFENKKQQEIKHFSSEDTPVSVGFLVDISGSMANKLDRVREAVGQFCETANPQDEFFMITFADEARLATDFTTRPEEIENDLLTARPKGRTALLDAIYMAIGKMRKARYSRRALIILSDGGDNHSRYNEHNVRSALKESDVLVYSVGTFDRTVPTQEELLGPELLREITGQTGGQSFTLTRLNELPAVTRTIGTQLRHQYMLAYQPQTRPLDGKWHKINVRVQVPKKLQYLLHVSARSGYYAGEE